MPRLALSELKGIHRIKSICWNISVKGTNSGRDYIDYNYVRSLQVQDLKIREADNIARFYDLIE